jgi:prepilin-type N-terminal cleavage/methylation domain-containing protein
MNRLNTIRSESGMTIIELLFVMVIVGTLAGLAISSWVIYKTNAYNATAYTDLKNGLLSLESYLSDNEAYPDCDTTVCQSSMDGFAYTPGVHIAFASTGGESGTALSCYPQGGDKSFYRPSVIDLIIELPIGSCGS